MGQALYRKYRSRNLSEIVGQEHITTTLDNALKQGRISHAYLFTGPRGTGKTSIARILANEVNGLAYDEQATHMDIIEIDAASNRRIDEIRELRERVHTAPTSAKYKVYIIDEVHMLTKEAFNALLKTLEEPPAHVIFVLATTESHKLPETIISRTQRFTFKPVDQQKVVDHLSHIAKQEKITISPEALELIAQHGGGSFRDSISLLDQASNTGQKVVLEDIQHLLGIAPQQAMHDLIAILQSGNAKDLVELLGTFKDQGYQPAQTAKQLAGELRQALISGEVPFETSRLSRLLHDLLNVPASHDPGSTLELLLIDQVIDRSATIVTAAQPITKAQAAESTPAPQATPEPLPVEPPVEAPESYSEEEPVVEVVMEIESPETVLVPSPASNIPAGSSALNEQLWHEALNHIKKTHNTLYGVARMAQPAIEGDTLTLIFSFAFHQKRINETKNKQVISDVITKLTGSPVTIVCVVGKALATTKPASSTEAAASTTPEPTPAASKSDPTIDTISNIFGGAEILE